MDHDDRAYCWDFNEDGYCKHCGQTRKSQAAVKRWPRNTWLQRRRAEILKRESAALITEDS